MFSFISIYGKLNLSVRKKNMEVWAIVALMLFPPPPDNPLVAQLACLVTIVTLAWYVQGVSKKSVISKLFIFCVIPLAPVSSQKNN